MKNIFKFRNFKEIDINDILKIYNFYINNGYNNFEENQYTYNNFKNLCKKISQLKLPFIVCETDNKIVGFAYLNIFREKSGYRYSYENTIYVDKKFIGEGIGNNLLKKLIFTSKKNKKIKSIVAVIGSKNSSPSIKIHEKNKFKLVGILKKVGFKNGIWLDSILMQRNFK